MPSFDLQTRLNEDQQRKDKLEPLRFGYGFEVSYRFFKKAKNKTEELVKKIES